VINHPGPIEVLGADQELQHHAASERTFLAKLRIGLAVIAYGIVEGRG
jgi:uncharacterized membrane protein YidH (DUF202 family)